MKFSLVCAFALLVAPDATNANFSAIQKNVVTNTFQNNFKSVASCAPNSIKNFFKSSASSLKKPSFYKAAQTGFASNPNIGAKAVASPLTEQPVGFVQNAKNSLINGLNKFASKPINNIAPSNLGSAPSNLAAGMANNIGLASNNIGFAASNNIASNNIKVGIQTEGLNVNSINNNLNVNSINNNLNAKPINNINNAAYKAPLNENLAANNAPKATAWNQPLKNNGLNNNFINNNGLNNIASSNNAGINNVANNIINKEGSSLGINAAE